MLFVFKLYFLIRICFHRTSTMYRCDCDVLSIFIPIVFTRSNFPSLPTYDWWWWMSFSCLAVTMVVCNTHFGCMAIRLDPSQDLQSITGLVRNGQEVGFLARRSGGSGGHHSFLRTDWTRSQWFVVLCFHIHD